MMISPMLFLGKNSLPQSHPMLSSDPIWWLSCWLKVCQHLRYWSIKSNQMLTTLCLANLWLAVFLCLCICCLSCLWVSLYCLPAFCSMSWRKITQPGSLEEPTCRRKSFVLWHCSSFSWGSSFRFASLYCTWNSSAQTLCFALGMHLI